MGRLSASAWSVEGKCFLATRSIFSLVHFLSSSWISLGRITVSIQQKQRCSLGPAHNLILLNTDFLLHAFLTTPIAVKNYQDLTFYYPKNSIPLGKTVFLLFESNSGKSPRKIKCFGIILQVLINKQTRVILGVGACYSNYSTYLSWNRRRAS